MNRRLRWLYTFAVATLAICALAVAPLGATWTCCNDTAECSGADTLCCDPEVLQPCYDTWWPFDQIDGYCMSFAQCAQLN